MCVEKSDVVCCTLSGAGSQPILEVVMRIPGFKFDAVIIGTCVSVIVSVSVSVLQPTLYVELFPYICA